jgi:hypothetical protein
MTSSDNGALGSVTRGSGSDCGTGCRTLSLLAGLLAGRLLWLGLLLGWW